MLNISPYFVGYLTTIFAKNNLNKLNENFVCMTVDLPGWLPRVDWPAMLYLGKELRLPVDLQWGTLAPDVQNKFAQEVRDLWYAAAKNQAVVVRQNKNSVSTR